jgi:SAM domain (Sterile alpha motif)
VPLSLSVQEWLKSFGLGQYWDAFDAQGYDSLEIVSMGLDEAALDNMEITKNGYRTALLKKAKELLLS